MEKDTAPKTAHLLSKLIYMLIYILRRMEHIPLQAADYDDLLNLAIQAQQLAKPD